ncbi:hypothetical protein LCGC14_1355210 [marine sediment metagenome]|uniref:Uncharacterized protein n=1 Tax=marine sediment metagenome TaxID=412755 RepID=A0A0F9NC12_9ZZZZ|nr:hypothetical protein [Candidatus Aminicenantes bacterium]
MYTIGVDNGFSGAIAILREKNPVVLMDMPVLKVGKTKLELDENTIRDYFSRWQVKHVFIEKAQVMPKQGISSSGRYMMSYGIIRGICVGLRLPYTLIAPQTWKKAMLKDMPKGKEASIFRAKQLYPELDFPRKKDHGKADALLIALYGLNL